MSLKKLFNFDHFLQHLRLKSGRYASQNGRTFAVSVDKLWALIGISFGMGYHQLPTLPSHWETGNPSVSVNYVANVITRERFKEF